MASPKKNIVIIGGSYAGVSIAHNLLKHAIPVLPEKSSYEVILVSTASQVVCRPACPRALISDDLLPQDKLFVDIAQAFEQYPKENFRFVQGTATDIKHGQRSVSIDVKSGGSETISYHTLVIATGSSTPSPLFSLNKDENFLRENWKDFRRALANAKSIVIVGGGPTGVETAGELGEYLNGRAGFFSYVLANPKVKITLVTSSNKILPNLRPTIAKKAEDFLARVGVTLMKNARVNSVSPTDAGTETNLTANATATLENGETLSADLYIPAAGIHPNTSFLDKSLLAADGRVDVNTETLRVDKAGPFVYALGDASNYARPAVHNLINAVPIVSANIKRDLLLDAGKDEQSVPVVRKHKEDTRETQLVPIGQSKGVGSAMGWSLPSILVWAIKGRDYWLWTTGNLWSGKQWAKEG